jgi:hypothetical protein
MLIAQFQPKTLISIHSAVLAGILSSDTFRLTAIPTSIIFPAFKEKPANQMRTSPSSQ